MYRAYARHPYLDSVSGVVADAGVDIGEMTTKDDSKILDRAVNRIQDAIENGEVGKPKPAMFSGPFEEQCKKDLLSYPVSRILVSIVADEKLIKKYATAEARRSMSHLRGNTGDEEIGMSDVLDEFEFGEIRDGSDVYPDGHQVPLSDYLQFAPADGQKWSLSSRAVVDGYVPVSDEELYDLVQSAITMDIQSDLPLDVPDVVAENLSPRVTEIRQMIQEYTIPDDIDVVDPDSFPDCFAELYARATTEGEHLSEREHFALACFLSHAGMTGAEIRDKYTDCPNIELVQLEQIAGLEVPPPGCDALIELDVCSEESCPEDTHPLTVYARNAENGPGRNQSREESARA